MGNLFSSSRNEEILRLEGRIKDLEGLDKNKDGVVTKNELSIWEKKQQAMLDSFRQQISEKKDLEYHEKMNSYQLHIAELEKEIKSLKAINHKLEQQWSEKTPQNTKIPQIDPSAAANFVDLSEQRVHEIVDRWMTNEKINIYGFPDYIEKHLYRNVVSMLLALLKEVLESSSVEFLGHRIDNLTLRPVPPPKPESIKPKH